MDNVLVFAIIGFFAQLVDGSLGMGYKVSSTTFLLSAGVPPVIASASVHTAGVFTSAISGYSHYRFGNFDFALIRKLAIPGVFGGVLGVLLLTSIESDFLKPIVSLYLLLMGIRIVIKALRKTIETRLQVNVGILGLIGGFFDAIGGGGWGPIVTTTLVADGYPPRVVIGSVNIAEWFVTIIQAMTFFLLISHSYHWNVILGVMLGGALAAPLAAYLVRRLPVQRLMLLVGVLICLLSLRTLLEAVF